MKKKILSLCLVVAMVATAVVGASMAYLTDTDSASNVFTVGNISIDLTEEVDKSTADVTKTYDDKGNVTGASYSNVMPGDWLQKEVTVTNDGANDAYVAVTVTLNNADKINAAIDEVYEKDPYSYTAEQVQAIYDSVFVGWDLKYEKTDEAGNALGMRLTNDRAIDATLLRVDSTKTTDWDNDYYFYAYGNWFQTAEEMANTGYGRYPASNGYYAKDMGDYEFNYTYYLYLEPKQSYTLFEGLYVPADFNADQLAMFKGLNIKVEAAAIQKDNFTTAKEAFTALKAELAGETMPFYTPVSTAEDLVAALEAGEDVVLTKSIKIDPASMSNAYGTTGINIKNGQTLDGNGYTIDIKGAGGTWDSGINTTGGTIKDVTVTGSFRGIFINHNSTHSEPVILENVIIDGTVYTISCDQGTNQTLTATNCTFNGWTSYAATLGTATFVDCSFGEGSGYAFCRPYAPTNFIGCDFEAGYEMDPRAAVTFENCTIDGVALTADNLATLVTSNIANATVK